jgi:hypothetical protein
LALIPVSSTRFEIAGGTASLVLESTIFAEGRPAAVISSPGQPNVRIEPVASFAPTAADLAAYVGTYRSDEAEATYTVGIEGGKLVIEDRWGAATPLEPQYPDAFDAQRGPTIVFRRGASGRVEELSWSESRVWDLRFRRVGG